MRTFLGSCSPSVCTLFLVSGTSAFAQSATPASALMMQQPQSQNCPVSLHADRPFGGMVARAAAVKSPNGNALHVSFKSRDANGITHADLILHGMSGAQVVPARAETRLGSAEAFSVSPSPAGSDLFDTVVQTQKLTAVDYLEVRSITFADGTAWHSTARSTCRVSPDGYRLVASVQ